LEVIAHNTSQNILVIENTIYLGEPG